MNKMISSSQPSPAVLEALSAKKQNKLLEWLQGRLLAEKNQGLLDAINDNHPDYIDIFEFPLAELKKIEGPEDVHNRQPLDIWEKRVAKLSSAIEEGVLPPPIVVADFWKPLELIDGNHRHEALLRNNIHEYWTIFLLQTEEAKTAVRSLRHPQA
jgi:hypothetical protein